MALKRLIADLIEPLIGARIVRPNQIALLFEEDQLRRFFDHFKVDCIFDVGANAGQYGRMLRSRVGYDGPIISFEPNPDVVKTLREVAKRDHCWLVEEVALGAVSERAKTLTSKVFR